MAQKKIDSSPKPTVLYILRILQKHATPETPKTAVEVMEYLENEYGIILSRRTMKRYLDMLEADAESRVVCACEKRAQKDGVEIDRKTNWYCTPPEHKLDRWDLIFLGEGIVSSKKIPVTHKKDLIGKLKDLGDTEGLAMFQNMPLKSENAENMDFFYAIALIDEAMTETRCLSFHLGTHNLKGKLVCAPGDKPYVVDPECVFADSGRYYLKATPHGGSKSLNFRIDMICNIDIAEDDKGNPLVPHVKPLFDGLDADSSAAKKAAAKKQLAHLFGDEAKDKVKLRIVDTPKNRYQLFDRFNDDLKLRVDGKDRAYLTATFRANRVALKAWVMGHAEDAEVIEPEELREEIHNNAVALMEKYKGKRKE